MSLLVGPDLDRHQAGMFGDGNLVPVRLISTRDVQYLAPDPIVPAPPWLVPANLINDVCPPRLVEHRQVVSVLVVPDRYSDHCSSFSSQSTMNVGMRRALAFSVMSMVPPE